MLTNRLELLSSRRNGDYGDALPLSYVSIIQKCLHPLIVFEFCYSLHLCITSRLGQKSTMQLRKRSFHLLSIVKFAVIKLRGGFKPHFCHTRPIVCPSWASASSATRKHCNCEYWELPPQVLDHSRILGISFVYSHKRLALIILIGIFHLRRFIACHLVCSSHK